MHWSYVVAIVLFLAAGILLVKVSAKGKEERTADGKKIKSTKTKSFKDSYSEMFLSHSRFNFIQMMLIKILIFLLVLGFMYAVKITNISFYTDQAYHKLDIDADIRYRQRTEIPNPELALEQEVQAMEYVRSQYGKDEFLTYSASDIMFFVDTYVETNFIKTVEDQDAFTNKVYYRALAYYECRVWEHMQYFMLAFLASMLAEVFMLLNRSTQIALDRDNIEFLKKIFVISGTLNPSFRVALDAMKQKARPRVLEQLDLVQTAINKTQGNPHDAMVEISKNQATTFERLFFEKLDEAHNADFEKAIINIDKELKYERSDIKRKFSKKVQGIHTAGQVWFYVLMGVLMFYFFIPWMALMNMDGLLN